LRKVILTLLLFSLLAFPGQAWVCSLQGSIEDTESYSDLFISGDLYTLNSLFYYDGYDLFAARGDGPLMFIDPDPYTDFSFLAGGQYYASQAFRPGLSGALHGYNESGEQMFTMGLPVVGQSAPYFGRVSVDWVENNTQLIVSVDGESCGSVSVSEPVTSWAVTTYQLDRLSWLTGLTSESSIIGGPDSLTGDSYQFYYSFPSLYSTSTVLKLFDPSGDVVYTISSPYTSGLASIPAANFTAGVHTLRMYRVYASEPSNLYYLGSKQISVGEESSLSATLELDKSTYATGDTMSIYAQMPVYAPGHVVNIYPKGSTTVTFPISSSDISISYTIPNTATPGTWLATIQDTATKEELAMEHFIVYNPHYADSSVHFEREAYTIDDQVRIIYKDLPPGTTVLLRGSREGPTKVFEKQWDDRIGAGTLTYQLSGQNINHLETWASLDGSILGYDLVQIAQGTDYILSGAVYDALSNVPLPGCQIGVNGNFKYTDEAGRYSLTLPAGSNYIQLFKDGYHSDSLNLTLSNPTTTRSWYLVPVTSATGGTLYGATANYADGSPVGSVYVRIYNESDGTSHSMLTKSSTGYYSFDSLPIGSTWTLEASKTDYDNYKATVTVSGETLHLVRLVPEDYDPNALPANDGDSSTTGTTSTDERPSRAAARESLNWLEGTMPSLIKFVVVVFFMALLGMKL
jgi:hypothetical protein